jgi:hypothetical protein
MPVTSSIQPNFASLPDELENLVGQSPIVINESVMDGFGKIRKDFQVEVSDSKTPIMSIVAKDANKPASDDFTPTADAVKIAAKLPTFFDIDIDLVLKRSDMLSIFRSYQRLVTTGQMTKEQVLQNPWQLFFLETVMKKSGEGLALYGTYKGVFNQAGFGSSSSIDGLLKKFTAGRGVGGDIPSANVLASAATALSVANIYDEVRAICALTDNNPSLSARQLKFKISPTNKRLYDVSRRGKFPNTVGPNETAVTVDDYDNITFDVDVALAGSNCMFISPDLFFFTNEDVSKYHIKMKEYTKYWELNVLYSACVEYGLGSEWFGNNRL